MAATLLDAVSAVLVLVLVALGLAVVFGMMRVINMAHGELVMLGAFTVVWLQGWHVPFWGCVIAAAVVVGLLGWMIEWALVRHTRDRPLDTILATWGLSVVLKQGTVLVFGPGSHSVPLPLDAMVGLGALNYPEYRLVVMAIAAVVIAGTYLFLRCTNRGLATRAVMARPATAELLGFNTDRTYSATFAAGAALAGLAGALVAPLVSVDPQMGLGYLVPAFLAILVGGAGALGGVLAGGSAVGASTSLLGALWSPVTVQIVVFGLAVAVIRLRPQGLMRE